MTVKEIAQAVGKDPATVSRWVEKVSCKVQEVSCKVQEAKATKKPADYTLSETIKIIKEGMGDSAAGVFEANATAKPEAGKLPNGTQLKEIRLRGRC